jgi:hypothetical protein
VELQTKLKAQFEVNLKANGSLPSAVCDALAEMLSAGAPASGDVLAALSKQDDHEEEVVDE